MYGNIANNWKNEEWRGLRRNKVQGRWGHICLSLLGVLWQKTMGCGLSKRHWVLILLEAGSPGAGCQHHQGPGEGLLLPCSWLPSWSIPTWQGEAAGLWDLFLWGHWFHSEGPSLLCVCVCACEVTKPCLTLWDPWTVAHQAPLSMDSSGKNTGVGCHALLQEIFPIQRSNLHLLRLLHCRQILYRWATREAPTLMTSSRSNHPPEIPFPNTITLGTRALANEFWGRHNSVCSNILPPLFILCQWLIEFRAQASPNLVLTPVSGPLKCGDQVYVRLDVAS